FRARQSGAGRPHLDHGSSRGLGAAPQGHADAVDPGHRRQLHLRLDRRSGPAAGDPAVWRTDRDLRLTYLWAGALIAIAADERTAARVVGRRTHAARGVVIIALLRGRRVLRFDAAIARRNRDPAARLFDIA